MRHSGRSFIARVLVCVLAAGVLASIPSSAGAAPGLPELVNPKPGQAVKGNPIFRWKRVPGASIYRVQVSRNQSFTEIVYTVDTFNTRATPPEPLPLGQLVWRVAAIDAAGVAGKFARASFQKVSSNAPVLITPENGATLTHPTDPPLFSWEPVTGVKTYKLEIDDAPNFINATEVLTESTYFALTSPQTVGQTFYWRVQGAFDNEVNTARSEVRTYRVEWDSAPQLVSPADTTLSPIEDVVFEWEPVVGASSYELQVSPNGDWANNVTLQATVRSTRFSPAVTLDNASYYWRVRALDQASPPNLGEWSQERQFRRGWVDKPIILGPPPGTTLTDPDMSWTPVDHAASYEVDFYKDPNFSPGQKIITCTTNHTRFTLSEPCDIKGGTVYWRVRGVDAPSGVVSPYSEPSTFTAVGRTASETTDVPDVTYVAPASCTGAAQCVPLTETPTLRWNHLPQAVRYEVAIALDPNFTNVVQDISTPFNSYTPPESLLDNQAGESYYWFVRACNDHALTRCGKYDNTVFHKAQSFRKRSPAVELVSPADAATVENQVTFTWRDYLATNQSANPPGTDEAATYKIEVSTVADFATILDSAIVDQTTYTASGTTYPEGPLYWRVQAIDASGNSLTFSETRRLTKSSPRVVLAFPADKATVSGLPYFAWSPQPYANTYEVEIYKKGDLQFSAINLVASQITSTTAFAPLQSLPPGDYAWRVRRQDASGKPGPWSLGRLVTLKPGAPALLTPKPGVELSEFPLFQWKGTERAVSYVWAVSTDPDFESIVDTQTTTMTSWAPFVRLPRGVYYWSVLALDADGSPSALSSIRSFGVGQPGVGNRSVTLKLERHLSVSGRISTLGSGGCLTDRVLIQLFDDAVWQTIKTVRTSDSGTYRASIPDTPGTYRARIKRSKVGSEICSIATSRARRHFH
ncbi:MAG TPA: hypothetical protein VNC78_10560 [Actinomycetota bacterium]|nr:hypothetical protein [Actinomycetota bacterium]